MFSQAESKQISDDFTAVRLLGGNDLDDAGRAFMERYGVGGYPTLLAMTSDGAVVGRDLDRSLEGILKAMGKAAEADATFRARVKEIGASQLPEALREMAGLYKDRMQNDLARANYEKLVASKPQVEDQVDLLEVLTALGDKPARIGLLTTLVATRKDHEDHIQWRMDLATADLPTKIETREQYTEMMGLKKAALEKLVKEVKETNAQAVVRNELADTLARLNEGDAAVGHWDWILANVKEGDLVPEALWGKAYLLINMGYVAQDLAKVKEARALFQKLAADHAGHMLATRAQRVLPQADGLITQLEAKAKEAEEKKEGDEEKPGGDGK